MKKYLMTIVFVLLLPSALYAQPFWSNEAFIDGVSHPVLGFDHQLAMVSVGILSAQIGGRAIWTVPATFVVVMAGGWMFGVAGVGLLAVEYGIATSVFVLGVAVSIEKKTATWLAILAVGMFGVYHGYAHGTEMPFIAEPIYYVAGFLAATISLHVFGVVIGHLMATTQTGARVLRNIGSVIACVGLYLVISV